MKGNLMNYKGSIYNRIIIVGSAGSGKSYLSKMIAKCTKQKLIHLDNEYWKPNWIATPKNEWIERQKTLISGDRWIIDGNYNSTLELRFMAADCIIFLDMNRLLCICSAWKRHGKKRSDLPEYLEEKKDKEFLDFIKWIWEFPKNGRKRIMELHNIYPDKPFVVLKSRREIKKFLKNLENNQ